jgi:hypothetical protein
MNHSSSRLGRRGAIAISLAAAACVTTSAAGDRTRAQASSDFSCSDIYVEEISDYWVKGTGHVEEMRASGCSHTAVYICPVDDGACDRTRFTVARSEMTMNGEPFVPNGPELCRSGEGQGQAFFGVDLTDAAGSGLRLVQSPDGSISLLASSHGARSKAMTGCATATLSVEQGVGVTGKATADCAAAGWTVKGTIEFSGCD